MKSEPQPDLPTEPEKEEVNEDIVEEIEEPVGVKDEIKEENGDEKEEEGIWRSTGFDCSQNFTDNE